MESSSLAGTLGGRHASESLDEKHLDSEEPFRRIAAYASDGIVTVDEEGCITFWNDAAVRILGYTAVEAVGRNVHELLVPVENRTKANQGFACFQSSGRGALTCGSAEQMALHRDGRHVPVELSVAPLPAGGRYNAVAIVRDISARKMKESQLKRLSSALEQFADQAVITDAQGRIEFVNRAFERVTGYSRDQALGETMRILKSGKHDADFYQRLWATILDGRVFQGEIVNRRASGELFYSDVTITPLRDDDGCLTHFVVTSRDVTDRRLRDPLTGLATRVLLLERVDQALACWRRDPQRQLALLFVDLDRFRTVNETHGPAAGDEVLVEMGRRIRAAVLELDTVATTSHLDRDEFAILLEPLGDEMSAHRLAEHILQAIQRPVPVGGAEIVMTASVGIVFGHDRAADASDVLSQAEMAMSRAKARPDESCHVYDAGVHTRAVERLRLEGELRHALSSDEIILFYQPVVELRTGAVVGGEALVRWQHPERGRISPGEFIPLAEETGLIIPLGSRILRDACRQARIWLDTMPFPLTVAVNVSSRQFLQPNFVEEVETILSETGIDSSLLEIEMTESTTAENPDKVAETLHLLKSLGIRLLLDDFGTGYSSLSYLTRFPLDKLKIDRSFVMRTPESKHDSAVAQTIVAMAHALGLDVVAEGVETPAQLEFLSWLGCRFMQGYLFSPPVPPHRFEELARTGMRLE